MSDAVAHLQDTGQPLVKIRNSNLELYRIIVMILIIAHHYVVNSGLFQLIQVDSTSNVAKTMLLFGAWGKTGINCFVLITGYYLCKSNITWQKLIKLYLQIIFYAIIIYLIFCLTGQESFQITTLLRKFLPVTMVASNFVGCFLVFYLLIPFLNILLSHINKKQHFGLMVLLIIIFSVMPVNPAYNVSLDYVEWFIILYLIAAYLRFYETDFKVSHKQWGFMSLILLAMGCISIYFASYLYETGRVVSFIPYHFISDSNKILSLLIAITSFMWFKGLKMPYIPFINILGATTFGVLLIHANSNAMRQWLWQTIVDSKGHYFSEIAPTILYACASVFAIFSVCSFIEWLRIKLIEPHILNSTNRLLSAFTKNNNGCKSNNSNVAPSARP